MRFSLFVLLVLAAIGCNAATTTQNSHDPKYLIPAETLRTELCNPNYEWDGPTSVEDRIPVLAAARALAYRGDSAATILFDAVDDPNVEIISVLDAISELGIPAHQFQDEIMARDSRLLRKWWDENQESTLNERDSHRRQIGLPPATIGT